MSNFMIIIIYQLFIFDTESGEYVKKVFISPFLTLSLYLSLSLSFSLARSPTLSYSPHSSSHPLCLFISLFRYLLPGWSL